MHPSGKIASDYSPVGTFLEIPLFTFTLARASKVPFEHNLTRRRGVCKGSLSLADFGRMSAYGLIASRKTDISEKLTWLPAGHGTFSDGPARLRAPPR
jgi:hypothetical protein